jgi:hypothetical protein
MNAAKPETNAAANASVIAIPGRAATNASSSADAANATAWVFVGLAVILIATVWSVDRRKRSNDHAERAFRRLARRMDLSRRTVRALRREAASRGLDSPVGLLLSQGTIDEAVARHEGKRRGPKPAERKRPGTRLAPAPRGKKIGVKDGSRTR